MEPDIIPESTTTPTGSESGDPGALAIQAPVGVPSVSPDKYAELLRYFKYASSSYSLVCPRPCGNHFVTSFSNPVTDIQGFVARDSNRKEFVVAIRGSASLADVILDGQILLVPLVIPGVEAPSWPAGTRVHSGFLAAWDSVAAQVLVILQLQLKRHPGFSLVTTGHSLGGSIALLAALSLKEIFSSTEVRTYSYGSPRTGNKIFAEYVNKAFEMDAHRVVHANDGVPTMIPSSLGYFHHSVEYWQYASPPSEATTVQCECYSGSSGEDPKCSVSIPSKGVNVAHTNYFGIMVTTPFCL